MRSKDYTIKRKKTNNRKRNISKNKKVRRKRRSFRNKRNRILRGGMEGPMAMGLEDPLTNILNLEPELNAMYTLTGVNLKKRIETKKIDPNALMEDLLYYMNPANYPKDYDEGQRETIKEKMVELHPKIVQLGKNYTAMSKKSTVVVDGLEKAMTGRAASKKQKPNEKCACGSRLKHKKCCGAQA
jgi:hypothetical protein